MPAGRGYAVSALTIINHDAALDQLAAALAALLARRWRDRQAAASDSAGACRPLRDGDCPAQQDANTPAGKLSRVGALEGDREAITTDNAF